ncbi:MAG: SRPBCC family protein [Kofleriaceae bacterium]
MSIYTNLVELEIRCTPRAVYDLVATPDHWPIHHPVTQAVRSETHATNIPADVGTIFIETIPRADHAIEATWEVMRAIPGELWEFRSRRFGDAPLTMTITYELEARGDRTFVRRFMRTDSPAPLPREMAIHFSLPDVHEQFLAIVKAHLER